MNKTKTEKTVFPWEAYSEVEFRWLEIILTKSVLTKEQILGLAIHCNIQVPRPKEGQEITADHIGGILLYSAEKQKLFPKVIKLIEQTHPKLLAFEECAQFYRMFEDLKPELIRKIYLRISPNKIYKDFISNEKHFNHYSKCQLIFLFIRDLYQV